MCIFAAIMFCVSACTCTRQAAATVTQYGLPPLSTCEDHRQLASEPASMDRQHVNKPPRQRFTPASILLPLLEATHAPVHASRAIEACPLMGQCGHVFTDRLGRRQLATELGNWNKCILQAHQTCVSVTAGQVAPGASCCWGPGWGPQAASGMVRQGICGPGQEASAPGGV